MDVPSGAGWSIPRQTRGSQRRSCLVRPGSFWLFLGSVSLVCCPFRAAGNLFLDILLKRRAQNNKKPPHFLESSSLLHFFLPLFPVLGDFFRAWHSAAFTLPPAPILARQRGSPLHSHQLRGKNQMPWAPSSTWRMSPRSILMQVLPQMLLNVWSHPVDFGQDWSQPLGRSRSTRRLLFHIHMLHPETSVLFL